MLYIFSGLPAAGKSTLARYLAQQRKAVHLRLDSIEQALRDSGDRGDGPEGYMVAYRVAADNLALGMPVIADSVNPLHVTRQTWRTVALTTGTAFVEIEVVCSDTIEHRWRVETRASEVAGLVLPTWQEVITRTYEPWQEDHIIIDTAGQTLEQSCNVLLQALSNK